MSLEKGKRERDLPLHLPSSLRCCYLSRVLLEVARQHLAQVQDRFVSCSEAMGTSPPFVVPYPLTHRQHRRVGCIVPGQDRGTRLVAGGRADGKSEVMTRSLREVEISPEGRRTLAQSIGLGNGRMAPGSASAQVPRPAIDKARSPSYLSAIPPADSRREPWRSAQTPAIGEETSMPAASGASLMPASTAPSPCAPWK